MVSIDFIHVFCRFFGLYAVFMVCIIFVFWFPRLFGFILFLLISIATCAYVLLSWYALRGEALRPPPCTPPPAFISYLTSLATYSLSFFHKHHQLPLLPALFPFQQIIFDCTSCQDDMHKSCEKCNKFQCSYMENPCTYREAFKV